MHQTIAALAARLSPRHSLPARLALRITAFACMLAAAAPAFSVNHYIVLFDGSGSVEIQHQARDNLWQGRTNDSKAMADIVKRFVDKALEEMPAGFPRLDVDDGDLVSFLIFHTDIDDPSYRLDQLFLTNESLLARGGLPMAEDFLDFDAAARTGSNGAQIALKDVFGGHSPLIAATAASLPFLADAVRRVGFSYGEYGPEIDNTFIIRITDGDYNTEANAADEHNVILRRAAKQRNGRSATGADDGFEALRVLTRQVNSVFDIGAVYIDCVFPTHNRPNRFAIPFDCADGAYEKVKGWGKGFLISYMSVEPKVPSLGGLARTEKTKLVLDTVYKTTDEAGQGDIHLIGSNPIFANSFQDPNQRYRLIPDVLEWRGDGADWRPCAAPDAGGAVDCNDGGPILDFREGQAPERLEYRARYLMEFTEFDAGRLLYPYRRGLDWVDLAVVDVTAVDLNTPSLVEKYYQLPRDPDAPTLSWLHPGRLNSGPVENFPEVTIDAAALKQLVPGWIDELKALASDWGSGDRAFSPRMVARVSRDKKDRIEEQEARLDNYALWFYLALVGIPAFLFFFFPRRTLETSFEHLAEDDLRIDFDDRTHESAVLVGMVRVSNRRSNLTYRASFKRIEATLRTAAPLAVAEADAKALEFAQPDRAGVPLGLGGLDRYSYEQEKVASGKELPVFFDPRQIKDLDQIAGVADAVFDIPASIHMDAGRAGEETLDVVFRLKILPEIGELRIEPVDPILNDDGHPERTIDYKAQEDAGAVCAYRLSNSAQHLYSVPVKGEIKIGVHDQANRPIDGALRLVGDEKPVETFEYYLRNQERLRLQVVVDFTKLPNPVDRNVYRVILFRRDLNGNGSADATHLDPASNGDERRPWRNEDEWTLVVERSSDTTEVSVVVLENEQQRSDALHANRVRLDEPFPIGSGERPKSLNVQIQDVQNKAKLFIVRLTNRCRDGHGHADWRAWIDVKQRNGVRFPPGSLRLLGPRGQSMDAGTLRDSPEAAQRELDLHAELDLSQVEFLQRDFSIEVTLKIDWQVDKEHPDYPDPLTFSNSATILAHLRHEPPRHILAIDFGTSAMAIAHAAGPRGVELLHLPQRLTEIEGETKIRRRWDDPDKRSPYFLASEFNICIDEAMLARTRPNDPDFLDLPLLLPAVFGYPRKCFSSLKSLVSTGTDVLPFDPREDPYLNTRGGQERSKSPPLDEVIAGAYKGLLQHFVEPILDKTGKGYSHVYITHPNTYTQNHVRELRRVVEQVFSGIAKGRNVVYPDNIHFVSESDAVAYYYLIYAHDLRAPNFVLPERERILVYDVGAGTLDLTYLEVDWLADEGGGYTPKHIRVRRRGGVTKAGDLLDECIARDLHAYLQSELKPEHYLTPIVVATEGEEMTEPEMRRMDELRQQIHQLKMVLSDANEEPSLELSRVSSTDIAQLVVTKAEETPVLYRSCSELRATQTGKVFWEPGRTRILGGDYVRGFIDHVTRIEVERFFGGRVPELDTVIFSGRTSLWPGFEQRLRETLGAVPNWVDFKGNADMLKQAVVLGVIEREQRWRNIEIEPPAVIGDFGVRYEPRAGTWEFAPYKQSGECQTFYVQHASEVRIGLMTNNGFHLCHSLLPDDYCGRDERLTIQLDFDATGYLEVKVSNSDGDSHFFSGTTSIPMLSFNRRPWPLGDAKLHAMTPEELMGDEGEKR